MTTGNIHTHLVANATTEGLFGLGFVDTEKNIDTFTFVFLAIVLCVALVHLCGCGRLWIRWTLCPRLAKKQNSRNSGPTRNILEEDEENPPRHSQENKRGGKSFEGKSGRSTPTSLQQNIGSCLSCWSSAKVTGSALSSILPASSSSLETIDRFHRDLRTRVAPALEKLVGVSLFFVAVRIAYVRFVDEEDDDDDDNNNGVKTETVGHATLRTSINLLERVLVLLVYYFLYRATIGFADCVANVIAVDRSKSRSKVDDLLGPLVSEACKFVIGLLYVIMSLQQLGLNVWTAVVGVGVLSLVCSFAAQEYVKSLFGLVTLVVERPLDVGDFVTINGVTGTVLDVSLRYCHVEGADACMYAVPNSYFLAGIVKNFSKRKRIYAKIEFDLLNDEEKRGDDEGGGRTGVKISVDGGVADEGIFRSADRFSIFRTGLLRAMNAKPEFVGGIAPSVRMGFHEGSVRCVCEVFFLQVVGEGGGLNARPKWDLFVEAEASLVLSIRQIVRAHGLRFASNPVQILGGVARGTRVCPRGNF